MKTRDSSRNIIRILLGTGIILSIPLVAMQFSDEWDWRLPDFIIIGTLLIGTGLGYEFATRNVTDIKRRLLIGLAFLAALLLIWAELAVGVFGTPFAGS